MIGRSMLHIWNLRSHAWQQLLHDTRHASTFIVEVSLLFSLTGNKILFPRHPIGLARPILKVVIFNVGPMCFKNAQKIA